MVGGFSEYLGMVVGSQHLAYFASAAYAGSLLRWLIDRRGDAPATAPA